MGEGEAAEVVQPRLPTPDAYERWVLLEVWGVFCVGEELCA